MIEPTQLDWFRRMVEIRLFEDKVQELFQEGLIEGTTRGRRPSRSGRWRRCSRTTT